MAKCADMISVKVVLDSYNKSTIQKIQDVVSEEMRIAKSSFKVSRTPEGKPYICEGLPNLEISVAHSEDQFVLGMNEQNVKIGLDIERIKKRDISSKVIKRFFSSDEQKAILSSENSYEELLRFWSRKESVVKCLGTGMIFPFASINTVADVISFKGKKYRIKTEKKKINDLSYWLSVALQSEVSIEVEFLKLVRPS